MVKFHRSVFGLRHMVTSDGQTHSRLNMDAERAVAIARKFLEQYHSPVIFKSAYLDDEKWNVNMEVGLLKEDIITVRIDAETGMILGYDHVVPA